MRKYVGEDKDSLIRKERGRKTSDARAVTHNLPQAGRPMCSWSWCSGCLGRQSHLFLFSLLLGLALCLMEHLFVQLRSAVLALSPSSLLLLSLTPATYLLGQGLTGGESKKSLRAVQVLLSNSQNTGMPSTLLVRNLEQSTLRVAMRKADSTPATLPTHVYEEHFVYILFPDQSLIFTVLWRE